MALVQVRLYIFKSKGSFLCIHSFYACFSFLEILVLTEDDDHGDLDHYHLESEMEDLPLKFEDIVDEKTYDKMRPPKPGGS